MNEGKECPVCGKVTKNTAAHIRFAHPDAKATTPSPDKEQPSGIGLSALGLSPETITQMAKQYLEPVMHEVATQAAANVGNDLMGRVDGMIDLKITAKFDQLLAQAQSQPSLQNPSPTSPSSGNSEIARAIATAFASQMAGGGGGGLGNLQKAIGDFSALQQLGNILNQPFRDGMRVMADMFAASIRAGASPEDVANAARKTVETLEPKSSEPPK